MRRTSILTLLVACHHAAPPNAPLSNQSSASAPDVTGANGCTFRGSVTDASLREPAVGATVAFPDAEDATVTDEHGRFEINIDPRPEKLVVYYNDSGHEYVVEPRFCGRALDIAFDARADTQVPIVVRE